MVEIANYIAAAVVVSIKLSKKKVEAPDSDVELLELFKGGFGRELTSQQLDIATRRLISLGLIKVFDDPYTGKFYRIPVGISLGTQIGMMQDRADLATFKKAVAGGRDFLNRVFQSKDFWNDLNVAVQNYEATSGTEISETDYVPASDRVVRLDHNSEPVAKIIADTRGLIQQLETGNDLGDMSPEEAEAARNEVKQIVLAFEGEGIRVNETFARVKSTLTWVVTRAAEAFVGSMALALLGLIANFFGFAL